MRNIIKGEQPGTLIEYKKTRGAYFDGMPIETKDHVRTALIAEQHHLCAYCMRRIKNDRNLVKIEHFISRNNQGLSLDYNNLLLCCLGNIGNDKSQCCDSRKGEKSLKFNPANPAHSIENHIEYKSNGRIFSSDEEFNNELNDILNLNHKIFVKARHATLKGVFKSIMHASKREPVSCQCLKKMLRNWTTPNRAGELREYCTVAIFYLSKKIGKTCD